MFNPIKCEKCLSLFLSNPAVCKLFCTVGVTGVRTAATTTTTATTKTYSYVDCKKCFTHGINPSSDPRCPYGCGRKMSWPPVLSKKMPPHTWVRVTLAPTSTENSQTKISVVPWTRVQASLPTTTTEKEGLINCEKECTNLNVNPLCKYKCTVTKPKEKGKTLTGTKITWVRYTTTPSSKEYLERIKLINEILKQRSIDESKLRQEKRKATFLIVSLVLLNCFGTRTKYK